MELSIIQIIFTLLIFCWTGFVRSGLGFGGAALGLPFMLLVGGSPIDWLPLIGLHLLFFSGTYIIRTLKDIDWLYLKKSLFWIIPTKIIGVIGLLSLAPNVMTYIVYFITMGYALMWLLNLNISTKNKSLERILLLLGGYISGTSLSAAPIIATVYIHNVVKEKFRNTLFVLWFILVTIKMTAFVLVDVYIDWKFAIYLLPAAAIGHYLGLKMHDKIIAKYQTFKYYMAGGLLIVCVIGMVNLYY